MKPYSIGRFSAVHSLRELSGWMSTLSLTLAEELMQLAHLRIRRALQRGDLSQ